MSLIKELSEFDEQRILVEWMNFKKILFYHIPNGGYRNAREARNLKLNGVKPGVPDICIPVPKKSFHGLYIELKRVDNFKISPSQEFWMKELSKNGYDVVIANGSRNAIKHIENYFK